MNTERSLEVRRKNWVLQFIIEDLSGNLFRNFFEKSTWVASSFLKLLFTPPRKFIFHLAFEKFLFFYFFERHVGF
jgi:hypothetical protein